VTNDEQFTQLDDLLNEVWFGVKLLVLDNLCDDCLETGVDLTSDLDTGNRSPRRPKKMSQSSAIILGVLKSLRALRRIANSS